MEKKAKTKKKGRTAFAKKRTQSPKKSKSLKKKGKIVEGAWGSLNKKSAKE